MELAVRYTAVSHTGTTDSHLNRRGRSHTGASSNAESPIKYNTL
ncbi:hypothetical protein [uncultured Duncaniella sp.]|nr:hypothetical protein [uncultured Duncaniella sp.]